MLNFVCFRGRRGSCKAAAAAGEGCVSEIGARRAHGVPPRLALPWHHAFLLSQEKSYDFSLVSLGAGNSTWRVSAAGQDSGQPRAPGNCSEEGGWSLAAEV